MKILIVVVMMISVKAVTAQSIIQNRWLPGAYGNSFFNRPIPRFDSNSHSKWSVSKYAGLSLGYSFFKGGSASTVSVPLGLQLNRKLTNNVYAFAGISAAPTYINFNGTFIPSADKTSNSFFTKGNQLGIYSRAELGLTYVNDAKTFSISGSVGIERNNMPVYYSSPGLTKPNPAFMPNRN